MFGRRFDSMNLPSIVSMSGNEISTAPLACPHPVVEAAFKKFELLIHPSDDRMFQQTTLEDVRKAAYIISRDQSQRSCLRNLNRVGPLFDLLNKLAGPIDALCQGTPYLCYIWAPIKLMLQIADEYSDSFDKLIDAYVQVARHLPRLDRLSAAFSHQPDFQSTLADIYSDILEFHSHAYRFLRRGGWKTLFDASWRSFGSRFNDILRRLDQGRELLDKEAASFEILESKSLRRKLLEDLERKERERKEWQLRDVLLWLDLKGQDREQEELIERRTENRQPGTCTWILEHPKISSWLDGEHSSAVLWLHGKPGSGKTTLATYLIEQASFPPEAAVMYCLCSYGFGKSESNACSLMLRSLIAQLVRSNYDFLSHVYDKYVKIGMTNSTPKTRALLKELLLANQLTYLVIDGVDECDSDHQKQILVELINLVSKKEDVDSTRTKILICSRETTDIARKLNRMPKLSLNDVKAEVERDITTFTMASLHELVDQFGKTLVMEIGHDIVRKANGMFLWVQLVISSLLDQGSVQDLKQSVSRLPANLYGVYTSILERIIKTSDEHQRRRIRFVLGLLASSCRILRAWEVCDFIVFQEGAGAVNEDNKLMKSVLNICKPFIEELDNENVHIVHFSAREFLFQNESGPYLRPLDTHCQITSASVRYLLTCDHFLSQPLNRIVYDDIVLGSHDLFQYVYEFWTTHLEQILDANIDLNNEDLATRQLNGLLRDLAAVSSPFASQAQSNPFSSLQIPGCEPTGPGLEHSVSLPSAIRQYLVYRNDLRRGQGQSITDSRSPNERTLVDPTALTRVHGNFLDAFERLINEGHPYETDTTVSPAQIDAFRSRHQASAFVCSFTGCAWASAGFPSLADRERHEQSHKRQFRCSDPECDNAVGGFTSKRALHMHREKYHTTVANITLPPFPRTRKTDPEHSPQQNVTIPASSAAPAYGGMSYNEPTLHDYSWPEYRLPPQSHDMEAVSKLLTDSSDSTTATMVQSAYSTSSSSSAPFLPYPPEYSVPDLLGLQVDSALGHNNSGIYAPPILSSMKRFLFSMLQADGPLSGWRVNFSLTERYMQIVQHVNLLQLLSPPVEINRAIRVASKFERDEFVAQPTEGDYRRICAEKLSKIWAEQEQQLQRGEIRRQEEQDIQQRILQLQHVVSNQLQASHNTIDEGLDELQTQQAKRTMQQMHAQRQQSSTEIPSIRVTMDEGLKSSYPDHNSQIPFTREDNISINQRAAALVKGTRKDELRDIVRRMDPRIRANLAQKGIDPIIYHFRMLATREFRQQQGQGGMLSSLK